MYLSKQWRESRIISAIAILALFLLLYLVVIGGIKADSSHFNTDDSGNPGFSMIFAPIFYLEAALIGFWSWLIASIGTGKNLGEGSGSFLITRPRRRAWFLWSDWGFAMAQIAAIILLTNLMVGLLIAHILRIIDRTGSFHYANGDPLLLPSILLLVGVGVLLFAGLVYSITFFSTILMKRAMGVMLGAGILIGYVIFRGLIHHYYPSAHLPNLIISLFHFDAHMPISLASHLGLSIAIRAILMLAFPVAAQLILDRSEI